MATVRSEMVREGGQEAEARVFIERMLHDAEKKKALGEALAARCQGLLDQRFAMMTHAQSHWHLAADNDWERRMKAELFQLAAEVEKALP